ncbi:MAG: ABC transporter permease [Dehalococcoidia bacterium]|nr:ABC transporter permease [Dehalococcoidia bacterium]
MSAINESVAIIAPQVVRRGPSRKRKLARIARQQPLGVFGLVIIVLLIVAATFAPLIAPYDPTSIEFSSFQSPGGSHLFGTDDKGRDVLSRVIYGSRTSLQVGIIATLIGAVGGAVVGLVSGYFGGLVDILVQRLMDALLAFPFLILALIMVAIFGNSIPKLMALLGTAIIPSIGRVMRGVVLAEKEKLYVEAARSIGVSVPRIMFRHILPNVAAAIIIVATSLLGTAILVEASLSFLGFGTPPPTPSWGADLSGNARVFFVHAPWMAIFPGIALSLVVLGFNLFGDALRDVLDPRLRNR